jgi:hypothetical protein
MKSPIKWTSKKIIALLVCVLFSFGLFYGVSAQSSTVMSAQASTTQPQVGSTLTVTIKISNVQNLAGIDTTLQWNAAVLSLTNSALNLGDSQPNGVLHGSNINYDENNLSPGDIYVNETKADGSYHLVAQSIGASTPGFSGSGTIVTLTFNVLAAGSANLSLQTDLADHPASGQTANNIDHQDTADVVTAVTTSSVSPSASASASASPSVSSSPSSSPSASPSTPEFPTMTIIAACIGISTVAIVLSVKKIKSTSVSQIKLP